MGDTEFDSFFDEPASDPVGDVAADDQLFAPTEAAPMFDEPAPVAADPAPVDMSNAFVTTQNLCADSPQLAEWRAQNQKNLADRAAKSAEELTKMNTEAKSARDLFYEQRKTEMEAAAKANKEEEDMAKTAKAELAQKDNLWESVTDMVDLQAKGEGKDISRMRSVMISMKNA